MVRTGLKASLTSYFNLIKRDVYTSYLHTYVCIIKMEESLLQFLPLAIKIPELRSKDELLITRNQLILILVLPCTLSTPE